MAESKSTPSYGDLQLLTAFTATNEAKFTPPHVFHAVADDVRAKCNRDKERWMTYFANENVSIVLLSKFELDKLGVERKQLILAINSIAPHQTDQDWSYTGVQKIVDDAQQDWEQKSRFLRGKPQKLYHDVLCNLEAHSALFSIIPSGNMSLHLLNLFNATTRTLSSDDPRLKASKSHRDTVEQLSKALKDINNEAEACVEDCKLIQSEQMKISVARFYVHVFLFYGDAIKWYKSRSWSKFRNSFNPKFHEVFKKALENIRYLSTQVRRTAAHGSAAEVRVLRLNLAEVQNDIRAGLEGLQRRVASNEMTQQRTLERHDTLTAHHQTLLQPGHSQNLCKSLGETAWQTTGEAGTRFLLETIKHESIRKENVLGHADEEDIIEDPALNICPAESVSTTPTIRSVLASLSRLNTTLTEGSPICAYETQHKTLFDATITTRLRQWTSASTSTMLYMEGGDYPCVPSETTLAAAKLVDVANEMNVPLLSFFCAEQPDIDSNADTQSEMERGHQVSAWIGLVLSLTHQLLSQLPDFDPVPATLAEHRLWSSEKGHLAWSDSLEVLHEILELAPALVFCVIDSVAIFEQDEQSQMAELLEVLRHAMQADSKIFKVLFTSQLRSHFLVGELDSREIAIVQGRSPNGSKRSRAALTLNA